MIKPVPITISILLLGIFIFNEAHWAHEPIIPVTVLKSRGVLLSCFAQVGLMMTRWLVLFYSPVYAIAVRGWNPASAGAMLVPTNAGFALGGLIAGFFHIRRAGSFYL
jgi:sugar phosphate permease